MSAFHWHGLMMAVAWLVLLPAGALVARFYKVLPGQDFPAVTDSKAWWRAHLLLQYGGTALAAAGLWTAWDALDGTWDLSNPHVLLGLVVMGLCAMQVVSAWLRGTKGGPTDIYADPADPGTWRGDHFDMTRRRRMFEGWHKRGGYLAFLLAIPTIWLGSGMVGLPWWLGLAPLASVAVFAAAYARLTRRGRRVDTWAAIWGSAPVLPRPGLGEGSEDQTATTCGGLSRAGHTLGGGAAGSGRPNQPGLR